MRRCLSSDPHTGHLASGFLTNPKGVKTFGHVPCSRDRSGQVRNVTIVRQVCESVRRLCEVASGDDRELMSWLWISVSSSSSALWSAGSEALSTEVPPWTRPAPSVLPRLAAGKYSTAGIAGIWLSSLSCHKTPRGGVSVGFFHGSGRLKSSGGARHGVSYSTAGQNSQF
jgi:hypothetical protein